jgi:prevent-host-death family protein
MPVYFGQRGKMFSVKGDATIACITDLKRSSRAILDRVDKGESVVIQKNSEAVGVLVSYPAYQEMMVRLAQLENIQLALLALKREERILSNREKLTPLDEVFEEFGLSPDIAAEE